MKKKIYLIAIFFIFAMLFLAVNSNTVYGKDLPQVVVRDHGDIYGTDGVEGASFNKETNTLTLNGYTGKQISFSGFEGKIKVNLIGKNKIDNSDDTDYNGLVVDTGEATNVELEIYSETDGELEIDNSYNGVYIKSGNLIVNGAKISINNMEYCGVYNTYKTLSIINADISVDGSEYAIISDYGEISIKKSNIKIKNSDDAIETYESYDSKGNIDISDSNIDIMDVDYAITCYGEGYVNIDNCNINIKNVADYGIYCYYQGCNIDNSTLNIENIDEYAIYCYYGGDIKINTSNINIKDAYYGIYCYDGGDITIKDTKLDIVNSRYGIATDEYECGIDLKNSDIYIKNATGCAMYAYGDIIIDSNIKIESEESEYDEIWCDKAVKINGGNINIDTNSYGRNLRI